MLKDGTYHASNLEPHVTSTGYYVGGVPGISPIILPAGATWWKPGTTLSYAFVDMRRGISLHPNLFLGVWTDNDDTRYIEASEWIEDRDAASLLAFSRREKAIWDVANGCEIRIEG